MGEEGRESVFEEETQVKMEKRENGKTGKPGVEIIGLADRGWNEL